jgi:DNA polymerase-3 subunit epsilon
MNLKDFLAFDVETANQKRSSICQIGYVKVQNLKIINEVSYLVQPPDNEYSAFNSNLHGISALNTKNEPFLPEIWNLIEKDFKSNILVAHNASFDLNALVSSLEIYGIPNPNLDCLCTMRMTGLGLKSLCESLEINLDKHHKRY